MFIPLEKLKEYALAFGVELDNTALERFDTYGRLLAEWNGKINLTSITDPDGIALKHFADSLSVLRYCEIPQGASLIDVGTGAGFPGLALLIARPDIRLTLLDSTKKKLTVIEDILNNIGLEAVLLHSRAEEAGQNPQYREKYDFATARAVANLTNLSEYCLPFVKVGGEFISMKSAASDDEIKSAENAIGILGGKIKNDTVFDLTEEMPRRILEIKKISQTPTKYPRPSAKIAKNPIK